MKLKLGNMQQSKVCFDSHYEFSGNLIYSSHIISIQNEMSERALELLALPEGKQCLLLDIGCGSGLSGEVLTENGHQWVGMDISENMLKIAKEDTECEGDLILQDMGNGVPFRPGIFDGAISISALQWLCHSNSNKENPKNRLHHFFQTLYGALNRGTRAVFQFYTETTAQTDLVVQQALNAGFNGGLVIDYPNSTKARKYGLHSYCIFLNKLIFQDVSCSNDRWNANITSRIDRRTTRLFSC